MFKLWDFAISLLFCVDKFLFGTSNNVDKAKNNAQFGEREVIVLSINVSYNIQCLFVGTLFNNHSFHLWMDDIKVTKYIIYEVGINKFSENFVEY